MKITYKQWLCDCASISSTKYSTHFRHTVFAVFRCAVTVRVRHLVFCLYDTPEHQKTIFLADLPLGDLMIEHRFVSKTEITIVFDRLTNYSCSLLIYIDSPDASTQTFFCNVNKKKSLIHWWTVLT